MGIIPRALLCAHSAFQHAAAIANAQFALSASFFEIYNEQISDLLGADLSGAPPTITMSAGGAFDVQGVAEVPVSSVDEVLRLLRRGVVQRSTGSSYKHNASSRSHCILRLRLASLYHDGTTRLSQFTVVDLAGSELLMAQASTKNMQESKNINLSLLTLKSVISALAKGASHVPFRESALTKLLSNALGGNSRTAVLCTCSPAREDAGFTLRTLRFGQVARKVRNRLASPVQRAGAAAEAAEAALRDEAAVETHEVKLQSHASAGGAASQLLGGLTAAAFPLARCCAPTAAGELNVGYAQQGGEGGASPQVAVLLHAYGSDCCGLDMQAMGCALFEAGYDVLMPDLPGFGTHESSLLKRCSGRTEKMDLPGGPLLAVKDVLTAFGVTPKRRAVAYGFDFGGTLCLGIAACKPAQRLVQAVSVFHANWTSSMTPLNAVSIPVQVLWLTVDQNHPITVGTKIARALPKGTLVKLKAAFFKAGLGGADAVQAQLIQRTCALFGAPAVRTKRGAASDGTPPSPPSAAAAESKHVEPSESKHCSAADSDDKEDTEADERGRGSFWEVPLPSGSTPLEGGGGLVFPADGSPLVQLLLDHSALGLVRGGPSTAAQAAAAAASGGGSGGGLSASMFDPLPGEADRSPAWAGRVFASLLQAGHMPAVLDAYLTSGSTKPQAVALLSALPEIGPDSSAHDLVRCGIWDQVPLPPGTSLHRVPRFPVGRQVIVRTSVCTRLDCSEQEYLGALGAAEGGRHTTTHKAHMLHILPSGTAAQVVVQVCSGKEDSQVQVPLQELIALNCGTNFRTSARGGVTFEDGVECKYSSLLVKGILAQCAASVQPLLGDIAAMWRAYFGVQEQGGKEEQGDVSTGDQGKPAGLAAGTEAQRQAVVRIAGYMNCTHIPNDGLHASRCRLPDVGRLAHFGQGHCHTQASVTCALLLAFGGKLGWDVKFRGGSVLPSVVAPGEHLREADQHTWCEVTLLPSCESLVFDATFREMGVPAAQAYSLQGRRHVMWGSMCDCNAAAAECEVLQ